MNKVISVFFVLLMIIATSVFADTTTGKISIIQLPTNSDVNTIYFKLNHMPSGVTQWFYVRHGSGTSAGCSMYGNEKTTDRAYSALLTAYASSKDITVNYCSDSNGYGLVNGFVRLNP